MDDNLRPSLSAAQLIVLSLVALAAASLAFVSIVLPAEFGVDPTGFGRLSGLSRLAAAMPETRSPGPVAGTRYYSVPFRTDRIDIPLSSVNAADQKSELEYKVQMNEGDSLVYSWTVSGIADADDFYYDFHSESPSGPSKPQATVVEYRQATGLQSNGVLIASLSGIHGWYLQNQSEKPAVVHLRMSGFYKLIPAGRYGNEAGVEPLAPTQSN